MLLSQVFGDYYNVKSISVVLFELLMVVYNPDDPKFPSVKSQLFSRFPLEERLITEELFQPARHRQGIMGRQFPFEVAYKAFEKCHCGAESTCPTIVLFWGGTLVGTFLF